MLRRPKIAAAIVVALMMVSAAYYYGNQTQHAANPAASASTANPGNGNDSMTNSVYMTSVNSTIFPTPVWSLSRTPDATLPKNNTEITLSLNAGVTGFALFHPGETQSNQQTATLSPPTNKSAYGWITPSPLNTTVPSGNWSMRAGVNVTGTGGQGSIYLGAKLYVWNSSVSNFTWVGTFQNNSINLESTRHANLTVNLTGNLSELVFNANERLFAEYFLNVSSIVTVTTFTFILASGSAIDASYFIRYPHFGWLNGSVTPSGALIDVNGTAVSHGPGGLFNLTLGQGTYLINASLSGYANYSSQFAIISGFVKHLHISLSREYAVNVSEKGLANGTYWTVNLSGMHRTLSTNSTRYMVTNGTYNLTVGSVAGYRIGPYPSNLTVNGSAQNLSLIFVVATYDATFSETGLSLPLLWGITINGVSNTSETSRISANLPNGTYNFSVLNVPRYSVSPSSGNLTVSGNIVTVPLVFKLLNFTISFRENGLPAGTEWSVMLNGHSQKSNTTVIAFNEPEGTYNYSIAIESGYRLLNGSGTLTVSGGNVTIDATFLTVRATPGSIFSQPLSLLYFLIIVVVLVQIEVVASMLYFRRNRKRDLSGKDDAGHRKGTDTSGATRPVSQILSESGAASHATVTSSGGHSHAVSSDGNSPGVSTTKGFAAEALFEYGFTYAVFEETAEKSLSLFEVALKKGLKGLCFTREFPDKLRKKHDLSGATVMWLSNIGSENSIRPKDLEKITLQCNESLSASQCIIMIDGLEYLITNNGFISVIKMLQFLRDATAVNRSILIISINQHAIKDSEVSLLRREADRIIE